MKTLTFFNEKGGVGKSLHTTLFASYLRYREGARVAVIDLENPTPRLGPERARELRMLSDPDSALSRYMSRHPETPSPYDIFEMSGGSPSYDSTYINSLRKRAWDFVLSRADEYDYVLFDFPAMLMEESPAFVMIGSGLVDLTVIPFDVDPVTRKAALMTAVLFQNNEQRVVLLWNNVPANDLARTGFIENGEQIYRDHGFEILPFRIKSFLKAKRDSEERLFVRSSVCWPDRYVRMACPELIGLYEDLKERLDRI